MTTIQIIEDDEGLQSTLADTLHYAGFDVLSASDARSGILMAQTRLPDLVLCDIGLPDVDGFQVLDALRRDTRTADIPVIFLTARCGNEAIREGMAMGADDYLCKPVHRQELLSVVRTRLKIRSELERRTQAKIDQAKAAMASRLPHELRTPLAGILGWAEVLETCDPADLGAMINTVGRDIRISGERLLRMTDRFLLYTQAYFVMPHNSERARLSQACPLATPEILAAAAARVAAALGRSSDLVVELSELGDDCIPMPEEYLVPMLSELAENAFKFSKPGQHVIINGSIENGRYHLKVLDKGRGLSPEQIRQVSAFRQFDRERFEQQGNGLGLAIATQLANLHGGSFRIVSTPGEGTEVSVSLPILKCRTCHFEGLCPRPAARAAAPDRLPPEQA